MLTRRRRAFSPLSGFMDEEQYSACVDTMRLPGSNLLFGLPIVLDTESEEVAVGQKARGPAPGPAPG